MGAKVLSLRTLVHEHVHVAGTAFGADVGGTGEGVHLRREAGLLEADALPDEGGFLGQRAAGAEVKAPLLRGQLLVALQFGAEGPATEIRG